MPVKGIIGAVIGDIAGSSHEFVAVSSPTRFNRHVNTGYGIVTIGATLEHIRQQIAHLEEEVEAYPERRYLIREIGISKAGYTVEQIAPVFWKLSGMKNVCLPEKFISSLRNQ